MPKTTMRDDAEMLLIVDFLKNSEDFQEDIGVGVCC